VVVQVKAIARELPSTRNLPLSRWSISDVAGEARRSGLVATISNSAVWCWLHEDAIRPWQHRCWIFPRDPLTPNGFPSLAAVEERLAEFERYYEELAKPFEWKFTRQDLAELLVKMDDRVQTKMAA
jgi:hypothetical protein